MNNINYNILDINIIVNIFINWLMSHDPNKKPKTQIWVMTHMLRTTDLK